MLLKETDTIDAILIVVLEQKQACNPHKNGSSRRHVWILFRYQCLSRDGKQVTSRKLFAGKMVFSLRVAVPFPRGKTGGRVRLHVG